MLLRYETEQVCEECGFTCGSGQRCADVRETLGSYSGIRFTADGFDCALPVSVDSHSHCSYGCVYCFSDTLMTHRAGTKLGVRRTSLDKLERIFAGEPGKSNDLFRLGLKYDRRNEAGYPCPIQLGALNDPCDHIERNQGWLLKFIDLAFKYRQPVRISTKGTVFQLPDYLDAVSQAPELFWVAFSIIAPDDAVIERIDQYAPNATERLKTMAALSKVGVKTSLRFRPMIPGISDSTLHYPKAYKTLIEKAAEAGAKAISYEVAFAPGMPTREVKARWGVMERVTGLPLLETYQSFGPRKACIRAPYTWTENIMHAVRDEARKVGMTVGVSDPLWKQLGDTGCCCGILPDDEVFGNWQRESATNRLLEAAQTGALIGPEDIVPNWANVVMKSEMCPTGVGPLVRYEARHWTWGDELRSVWNNPERERGPLRYFQGALVPDHRDEKGGLFYRYEGLKRQNLSSPWKV